MTGPEHYREAERRLDQAHAVDPEHAAYLVAKAQVHATLALAAATVVNTLPVGWPARDEWTGAIS